MKTLALAAIAATTLAGSAFAQGAGNLGAQQPYSPSTQAPTFQQGSNNRAGGPANELNTNGSRVITGPSSTGTVVTEPSVSSGTTLEIQEGSNNRAGGPANELNRGGVVPVR